MKIPAATALLLVIGNLAFAGPLTPTPPKLRLGDAARPERYRVVLNVDPTRERIDGEIEIDLVAKAPLPVLWLNANDLQIKSASAVFAKSHSTGSVVSSTKDFVGIAFTPPLPAGPSTVRIVYTAVASSKDSSGASRQKEGDDWYVYTHFEPIDARRVFPCFDEPSYKVSWQLTLNVPERNKAVSNTPAALERAQKGIRTVKFAPTKPLPSYLIAFAVGPFDLVDAGKSARSGTPIRIITPRGLGESARYAAESTRESLSRLEEYFGMSFPYEKLDCIAVPQFGGAMENAGLITFGSQLILTRPGAETISTRRAYASVATHEMAHMWFGDLVTMAWWDDLWLNEAFASWMVPKILDGWQPTWGSAEGRVTARSGAMGSDSLMSARKIRQPIESDDDMQNAFDGITYTKGAAVINMFERWVGAVEFQRGVQRYMKEHADGNATAADFLAAISKEAGRDIAPAFSTFLDQPGVPLVKASLSCNAAKTPSLVLTQTRYLPEGSSGVAEADKSVWKTPLCVRFAVAGKEGRACGLLDGKSTELPLTGAVGCPDWLLGNEGESGYFRLLVSDEILASLFRDGGKRLTVPERIGVLGDVSALVRAGKLPYERALALIAPLKNDPSRYVAQSLIGLVGWLRDGQLVDDAHQSAYARLIRDTWGARAHALGWTPKPGEDEDTRILRNSLLPLVADEGEDASLVTEANALERKWRVDHKAIDPEIVDQVLYVAAQHGDRALFDAWHSLAKGEKDLRERRRLLGAMAAFRDPAIARAAMALMLTDEFDARESMRLVWGATSKPATRPVAFEFVKAHFDELVAKLPRDSAASFPNFGSALCDDEHQAEVEQFFKDRSTKFAGGPRALAQSLESMRLCSTFRRRQSPSVNHFFGALSK